MFGKPAFFQRNQDQKLNMSPQFGLSMFRDSQQVGLISNKKRNISEITQFGNQERILKQKPLSPFSAATYQNIDDSSTSKPGLQTQVRNPTLSFIDRGKFEKIINKAGGGLSNRKDKHIEPVNLTSKSPFLKGRDKMFEERQNVEEDFESFREANFPVEPEVKIQRLILREIEKTKKEHPEDTNKACQSIVQIIDDISSYEANPIYSDIANTNSKGQKYEYNPLMFLLNSSLKLPLQILKEISLAKKEPEGNQYFDCGVFSDVYIAYFIVNKTLYLWSYSTSHALQKNTIDAISTNISLKRGGGMQGGGSLFVQKFDQVVTCVSLASNIPGLKKKLEVDERILIVATIIDIKFFILKKGEREINIQLMETDLSTNCDKCIVNKIVQFKKNGRIFYGGDDGHVYELNLESDRLKFLSLFTAETKRLKKNDLMEESIILKLLPSFLKISDKKSIIDLKIDETRNVMYSLSKSLEMDCFGQSVIEVYDLGMQGNQFKKLVSIKQYDLVKEIHTFLDIRSHLKGRSLLETAYQFQVIFIAPILFSESLTYHLLAVTSNGYRVFISFDYTEENQRQKGRNDAEYQEFVVQETFSSNWRIGEILNFPNEEQTQELSSQKLASGLFKIHTMNNYSTSVPLEQNAIFYNNLHSYLLYGYNVTQEENWGRGVMDQSEIDQGSSNLKLNFIKKNECAFTLFKQFQSSQDNNQAYIISKSKMYPSKYSLCEHYSIVNATQLESEHSNQQKVSQIQNQFTNRLQNAGGDQSEIDQFSFQQQNEKNDKILEIQSCFMGLDKSIAKLLGLREFNFSSNIKGSILYQYQSLSEMEKQVYLPPQKVNILTDQRILELVQLRPIDQLSLIVFNIESNISVQRLQDLRNQVVMRQIYQDLEDFIEQYSIKEVCAMCVQVLAEPNTPYVQSYKINEILNKNKKQNQIVMQKISQSQPRQSQHHHSVQSTSFYYGGGGQQEYEKKDFYYKKFEKGMKNLKNLSLECNFESLRVPRAKLHGLLEFLYSENAQQFYVYDQYPDLEILERREVILKNLSLRRSVLFYQDIEINEVAERIEIIERESIINSITFLQRCIEVMDFLEMITFEGDSYQFSILQKFLRIELLQDLTEITLNSLISSQNNYLIKKLLEASIEASQYMLQQKEQLDKDQSVIASIEILKNRTTRMRQFCNGLFSEDDSKMFIGESLLKNAVRETNKQRREELLKQALEQIARDPVRIDLQHVVPLLAETGNYMSIVDLCLRKIKLQQSELSNGNEQVKKNFEIEIDECYQVILILFGALDCSIQNTKNTNIISQIFQTSKQQSKQRSEYLGNYDEQNDRLFQIFMNKFYSVKLEQKGLLMKRIISRIDEFNEDILQWTIFSFFMHKSLIDFEILPKVSRDQFQRMCVSMIEESIIESVYFENMYKMMIERDEIEFLGRIVLEVVYQGDKIRFVNNKQQKFTANDKLQKVQNTLVICKNKSSLEQSIQLNEITQCLLQLQSRLMRQVKIIKSIEKKIILIDKYKLPFEMAAMQDQQKGQQKEQFSEELQAALIEQTALQQERDNLNSKIFEMKDLTLSYTERIRVYEASLELIVEQFKAKRYELDYQSLLEQFRRQGGQHFQELTMYCQDSWSQYLIENLDDYSVKLDSSIMKEIIQVFNKKTALYFLKNAGSTMLLLSDLERVKKRQKLLNTQYWLIEYCFQSKNLKIQPSEILTLLGYKCEEGDQKLQFSQQQQELFTQRIKEIRDVENFSMLLVILDYWYQKYELICPKKQRFEGSGRKRQVNFFEQMSDEDLFLNDLKSSGNFVFRNLIMKYMKEFLDNNKLRFEKKLTDVLGELFSRVKNQFEEMCVIQNIIQEEQSFLRNQVQQSRSQSFLRSSDSLILSPSKQKVNQLAEPKPVQIAKQNIIQEESSLVENKIKATSSLLTLKQLSKKPLLKSSLTYQSHSQNLSQLDKSQLGEADERMMKEGEDEQIGLSQLRKQQQNQN